MQTEVKEHETTARHRQMPQQLKLGENHIIAMADMVNGDCFTPPSVLKIKFTHYNCEHIEEV